MSYFDNEREAVFSALEQADSIVIFGHRLPDGDCVGSVMGMREALRALFPEKKVYAVGSHPSYLPTFIEPSDEVSDEIIENSLALMVDLSDLERVEDQRILKAKKIVCIDHHVSDKETPFVVLRDVDAPSATFVITKSLLLRYGKIPTTLAATYLYLGLVTDSGRFQYDAKPETFEIAKTLVEYGVDTTSLYNSLYRQDSKDLRYRSVIYQNFQFDGLVSYVCVTKKMYEELGMNQQEAGGTVNLLALLDDHPIWAAFTEQEDGIIRGELRSNGHYNVQKVAVKFGGGGHIPAAGLRLKSFTQVPEVLKALNEAEIV